MVKMPRRMGDKKAMSLKHCGLGDGGDKRIKERLEPEAEKRCTYEWLWNNDAFKSAVMAGSILSTIILCCMFPALGNAVGAVVICMALVGVVWGLSYFALVMYRDMKDTW